MTFSVQEIAQALGAVAYGDTSILLHGPAQPSDATENDLALAMNDHFITELSQSAARVAIVREGTDWQALGLDAAIITPKPKYALSGINNLYEKRPDLAPGIHASAVVAPDAIIGKGACIGAFVVIESGTVIGENARILSHCSISNDVVIGDECLIYQGVRIGARVTIGDRFIAQPNSAVGGDGFSFVSPEPGALEAARDGRQPDQENDGSSAYARVNSLGSVTIGSDVELGAGSMIDRGTISNTVIGDGTKIDNLVMIGHNVKVGKHCLLCAQVGVGGSTVVGDHVVLGGQVGVADHVSIGAHVVAAGKSGISSNVPPNRFIMGNPAIKAELNVASYKAYRRLPNLVNKVEKLQKQVSKLDPSD